MQSDTSFLPYFAHLKPVRVQFVLGIVFGIIFSVSSGLGLPVMAETVFPVLFGDMESAPAWINYVVQHYFHGQATGGFLILVCRFLPFVMGIRAVSSFGNGYYMSFTGISVVQSMQKLIYERVQMMPVAFFQKHKTGELFTCINDYPAQIKTLVVNTSNDLVVQPLTLLSAVSFLVYKSITSQSFFVAAIGVISVPLLVFPIRIIGKRIVKRSNQLVRVTEELNSATIESLQSPFEIRAYNMEERQLSRFTDYLRDIMFYSMKRIRTNLLINPLIEVVSALGIAVALFLGVRHGMSQGEFMALVIALYMSYAPAKKIGSIHSQIKTIEAAIGRFGAILTEPVTITDPETPVSIDRELCGQIAFQDVSFSYDGSEQALSGINVAIDNGEHVAIVGKSGAGKSSFANLIPRFYDVTAGAITIGGIDIRSFRVKDLRDQIAYVPQMPTLFNTTIEDNIRMGRSDATPKEIEQAAAQANALDFINDLPERFNTFLTERGNSLSGGQRQRIALARAFLKDAPILILDEATSALDNESDKLVQEALGRLCLGRTTLVIAHRLNSLTAIKRRLCFDNGRIVGDGSHEELLAECPHYAQMIRSGV